MPFTVRMYPSQSGKNEYSDSTPARDQAKTHAATVTTVPMINTRIEGGYTRSWSPSAHRHNSGTLNQPRGFDEGRKADPPAPVAAMARDFRASAACLGARQG